MESSFNIMDIERKIIYAANSDIKITIDELISPNSSYSPNEYINKYIERLLEERREIAKQYLTSNSFQTKESCIEVFLHYNETIKNLLGL